MKPYYNIVHKTFQVAILRKLRQFFQDGVTHVSDNTEYKMFWYTFSRKPAKIILIQGDLNYIFY